MQTQPRRKPALPRYSVLALTVIIIAWLTLTPKPLGEVEIHLFAGEDKVAHALLFFLLTAAAMWERRHRGFRAILSPWIPLLCALFGALIEVTQHYLIAGRSGDLNDWMADCTGILAALTPALFMERRHSCLRPKPRRRINPPAS